MGIATPQLIQITLLVAGLVGWKFPRTRPAQ
jgi:hypothetical protein